MPPATINNAIVPITDKLLITHGKVLIKRFPTIFDMLFLLSLKPTNFKPKSSILTIRATIPYTPIVAITATTETTKI